MKYVRRSCIECGNLLSEGGCAKCNTSVSTSVLIIAKDQDSRRAIQQRHPDAMVVIPYTHLYDYQFDDVFVDFDIAMIPDDAFEKWNMWFNQVVLCRRSKGNNNEF